MLPAVLTEHFSRFALTLLVAAGLAGIAANRTEAADPVAIGIVAPLSGPFAPLGQALRDGALEAIRGAGIEFHPVIADDRCEEEGGAAAGEWLAGQQVVAVVGFLCAEALEAAAAALTDAGIPILSPGVRAPRGAAGRIPGAPLVFRLAPRAADEEEAIATLLTRHWAAADFAIVDDGTVYGRNLADALRLAAEEAGLKPVFIDSYRPQMDNQVALARRLEQSGATHVFVGGDRHDLGILGRDAARIGLALTLAGGEALRAPATDPDLPPGTLMVALPERESGGAGYAAAAAAAITVLEAALDAGATDSGSLAAELRKGSFETAIGSVTFDDRGDRTGNRFRLFRYDGSTFSEVEP